MGVVAAAKAEMQIIFQNSSLDPRMKIGDAVMEPINSLGGATGSVRTSSLPLGACGAESRTDRYPHEFSGGQRQRFVSPVPRSQSQVHHLRRIGLVVRCLSAGTSAESLKELQAGLTSPTCSFPMI